NDFFTVYKDDVIQPDGKPGSYGIVDFPPGVGVLPVDDEGNVYLVKQFRYAVGRTSLEVLAGSVEDGEEPLRSAKREAKEEVGVEAEKWTDFGQIDMDTTIVKNVVNFFIAENLKIGEPKREGTEKMEIVKIKLSEAIEKVLNGEITHSISCVLLLKAARKYRI
ncbi:MAG TPA: NUDIX hydrolase, partial [Pyrinomonadaceae bacterium]|nr:NUDIX hydrolase [Pyrinomonadaceae bacterium]